MERLTTLEGNIKLYLTGAIKSNRRDWTDNPMYLFDDLATHLDLMMERHKITGHPMREKIVRAALRLFGRFSDWRYIDRADEKNSHLLRICNCYWRMAGIAKSFETIKPIELPPMIARKKR